MQKQLIDWEQLEAEEMQRMAELEKKSAVKRWATYPRPNPFSEAYGYGSTLYKLKGDMNNHELTPITRAAAARNYASILRKINDKPLMALRSRLIRATQAGDITESIKVTKQMRDYLTDDVETGQAEDR
jgi:hypothetical protein